VLVGASRKRFLGAVLAGADGRPPPAPQRDAATLATTVLAARAGAWGVRVHEVAGTLDAVRVVAAVG
jgi:dihydropteroate synthase